MKKRFNMQSYRGMLILLLVLGVGGFFPSLGWSAGKEEVVIGLGAEPRTLLAVTIVDWTTNAQLENIYDPLFTRDRETMKRLPWLATSYTILDDLTWEISLRPGVKFHNGEPFNAQAVKFTMEYLLNPDNKSHYRPRMAPVKSVEIVDEYTVRIHTSKPFAVLLERLTSTNFMPLPPQYIQEKGIEYAAAHPVGTGPYTFVEWVRDERLVLKKNEHYWAGTPAIEKVVFRFIPEFSARLSALLAGEIDIMKDVPPHAVDLVNNSQLATVRSTVSSRINYVALVNLKEGPMQDRRVRQAMNYAVNVDELIAQVLQGRASRICGPTSPLNDGYVPSIECYPYNPQKAEKLLQEAGYDPAKLELTLDTPSGRYPLDKEVSQAIAAQLNRIGIRVKVVVNEWGTHLDKIKNRRTGDMFFLGWGPALEVQGTVEPLFQGDWTYSGYTNPEVERKIQEAVVIVDPQKRYEAFAEIQKIVWEDAAWIFLWQQHDLYGVANWIDWSPRPDEQLWMFEAKRR